MAKNILSYSSLAAYKDCPRKYYLNYVLRLRNRVRSAKLDTGSGFHWGLRGYYENNFSRDMGYLYVKCWAAVMAEQMLANDQYDESVDLREIVDYVYKLCRNWFDFADQHDLSLKVLAVEKQFSVGIRRGWAIHSAIDAIVEDEDGVVWVMEHKTAKDAPKDELLEIDDQVSMYYLVATMLPELQGKKFGGVIYNVIRKLKRAPEPLRFVIKRSTGELFNFARSVQYYCKRIGADMRHDDLKDMYHPGFDCTWKCNYNGLCKLMNDNEIDWEEIAYNMYEVYETDQRDRFDDLVLAKVAAHGGDYHG